MVTNDQGTYSFPPHASRQGHYTLTIRAVGYTLQGPQAANVTAGKAAKADLTLAKTNAIANQLSNGEWLNSLPGDDRTKAALTNCVGCHTVQRIVQSTHDAAEFMQVFHRMGTYAPGSNAVVSFNSWSRAATTPTVLPCRSRSSRRWPTTWPA